jgi:hypothetical protein
MRRYEASGDERSSVGAWPEGFLERCCGRFSFCRIAAKRGAKFISLRFRQIYTLTTFEQHYSPLLSNNSKPKLGRRFKYNSATFPARRVATHSGAVNIQNVKNVLEFATKGAAGRNVAKLQTQGVWQLCASATATATTQEEKTS